MVTGSTTIGPTRSRSEEVFASFVIHTDFVVEIGKATYCIVNEHTVIPTYTPIGKAPLRSNSHIML